MDGAITLNLDIVSLFSDKELKGNKHYNTLKEKSNLLFAYYRTVAEKHEDWLSKKNGLSQAV